MQSRIAHRFCQPERRSHGRRRGNRGTPPKHWCLWKAGHPRRRRVHSVRVQGRGDRSYDTSRQDSFQDPLNKLKREERIEWNGMKRNETTQTNKTNTEKESKEGTPQTKPKIGKQGTRNSFAKDQVHSPCTYQHTKYTPYIYTTF